MLRLLITGLVGMLSFGCTHAPPSGVDEGHSIPVNVRLHALAIEAVDALRDGEYAQAAVLTERMLHHEPDDAAALPIRRAVKDSLLMREHEKRLSWGFWYPDAHD